MHWRSMFREAASPWCSGPVTSRPRSGSRGAPSRCAPRSERSASRPTPVRSWQPAQKDCRRWHALAARRRRRRACTGCRVMKSLGWTDSGFCSASWQLWHSDSAWHCVQSARSSGRARAVGELEARAVVHPQRVALHRPQAPPRRTRAAAAPRAAVRWQVVQPRWPVAVVAVEAGLPSSGAAAGWRAPRRVMLAVADRAVDLLRSTCTLWLKSRFGGGKLDARGLLLHGLVEARVAGPQSTGGSTFLPCLRRLDVVAGLALGVAREVAGPST